MRVGRSDRKNRRSASWMASARSWVTNSVVTFVRVVSATQFVAQPRGDGFVERHKGLIEQKKIRTHRKCAGDCRAARQVPATIRRDNVPDASRGQGSRPAPSDRRRPRAQAVQAGYFARPYARAAGEVPEIPFRDGRIPACGVDRGNPDRVRLQSSGSSSCRNRMGRSAHRTIRLRAEGSGRERLPPACRRPTERSSHRCEVQAGRRRQRIARRSSGCTRKLSITSISTMKEIA